MMANIQTKRSLRCAILGLLLSASSLLGLSHAETELPYTTYKRYNLAGQLTGVIHPPANDGISPATYAATRYTYGDRALLTTKETGYLISWHSEETAPENWTNFISVQEIRYLHDDIGQLTSESVYGLQGIESVTQYSYDAYGRLVCRAVRMNKLAFNQPPHSACNQGIEGAYGPDRITRYSYDNRNNVLTEERAVGTSLQQHYKTNEYDRNNNLLRTKDAKGNSSRFFYDGFNRLTHKYYPSKTSPGQYDPNDYERFNYDLNGNMVYHRKRDGRVADYDYDRFNRVITKRPSATGTTRVFYGYDFRGLQTYSRFGSHSGSGITNTFNGFGERTHELTNMDNITKSVTYSYDKNSNTTEINYENKSVLYTYNEQNKIQFIAYGQTTIYESEYDESGRLSKYYYGNGIETENEYKHNSQPIKISHAFGNNAYDVNFTFEFNPANQLISNQISNSHFHHRSTRGMDGIYESNGLNQYVTINGYGTTYDRNGSLTGLDIPQGQSTRPSVNYYYDADNRLTSVGGRYNLRLNYDPAGRLYKTSEWITDNETRFLYSGDQIIAEYTKQKLDKIFVYGSNGLAPIAEVSMEPTEKIRYLHTNHQGSVVGISDQNGQVYRINTYDEYGVPGQNNVGRFGYTGQVWLAEAGLYHYRARAYNPYLGRFLQTDPIGYEDQMNLYAYVHNDPLSMVDPDGLYGRHFNHLWTAMARSFGYKNISHANNQGPSDVAHAAHNTAITGGNSASTALAVLALTTPCTITCGTASFAIDIALSLDHFSRGDVLEGSLTLLPGTTGEFASISLKTGARLAPEVAARVGTAAGLIVNHVIQEGLEAHQTEQAKPKPDSENGASRGNVRICSGTGAQKERC